MHALQRELRERLPPASRIRRGNALTAAATQRLRESFGVSPTWEPSSPSPEALETALVCEPAPSLQSSPATSLSSDSAPSSSASDLSFSLDTCAICAEGDCGPRARLVSLDCGHPFHLKCIEAQIDAGRKAVVGRGARLQHGFLRCGLCRADVSIQIRAAELLSRGASDGLRASAAATLGARMKPHYELREECLRICRERALVDGVIDERMPPDEERAAIEGRMAAFRCASCEKPFCGGQAKCMAADEQRDDAVPRDDGRAALCQDCLWAQAAAGVNKCSKHGPSAAIFKCDSCCALATWDCIGNHYCDACHRTPNDGKMERPRCRGGGADGCPLRRGPHPPNVPRLNSRGGKMGFVLGCTACLGLEMHCDLKAVSRETHINWEKHRPPI